MHTHLAFSYRCCDICVGIARKLMLNTKTNDWWRIEALVCHYCPKHLKKRQPVQIYDRLRDIPKTDKKELTGLLFIDHETFPKEVESEIRYMLSNNNPIDLSWMQWYIWEKFEPHWLDLKINFVDSGVHGHLSVVDSHSDLDDDILTI